MGLISKRKIKTPTDKDYIISAAYTDVQEVLKPQPKMEPSLINIGALKKYIVNGTQGPAGPQGIQGIQGIQGVQGEQGIQGETGEQGTAGNSVTLLGSYADLAAFNAGAGSLPGANIGDAWILLSDGSLMTWNGTAWFDAGDIKGPQGDQGIQGIQGPQGEQGIQGIQGIQGPATPSTSLFAQTANSTPVIGTIVETTLIGAGVGTLTVPANGFQVGDSFRAIFGGVMNAANNQTIRIKLKTGSVILLDSGVQNLGSAIVDDVWSLNVDFTIRQVGAATVASIVSLGSFHYTKTNNASIQGFGFNVLNNTTFDTTVSNALDVTAEWGSTNAENNIYSDIFILNKTY
jgi:hypothetical protein